MEYENDYMICLSEEAKKNRRIIIDAICDAGNKASEDLKARKIKPKDIDQICINGLAEVVAMLIHASEKQYPTFMLAVMKNRVFLDIHQQENKNAQTNKTN
jgi:hypothetical protein